jgi:hypothetical protein
MKLTFDRNQIALAASRRSPLRRWPADERRAAQLARPARSQAPAPRATSTTTPPAATADQKLINKSTAKGDGTYGLDWLCRPATAATHRNCTLIEDAPRATPATVCRRPGP